MLRPPTPSSPLGSPSLLAASWPLPGSTHAGTSVGCFGHPAPSPIGRACAPAPPQNTPRLVTALENAPHTAHVTMLHCLSWLSNGTPPPPGGYGGVRCPMSLRRLQHHQPPLAPMPPLFLAVIEPGVAPPFNTALLAPSSRPSVPQLPHDVTVHTPHLQLGLATGLLGLPPLPHGPPPAQLRVSN